ncbi:hypothetical protein F4680DRAFT_413563 [Xylaria scruposa]|nr:hypothetical protein F4680DRAFT_413563 [Xylaria scruposa]
MSGLEIIGVVLGAFPLLIEAFEKYEEVSRRYGFWRRIRPEYRKCTHDFKYHSDVFRMNLRQLLLPQLVDDDIIERMISDPGGPEWKVPEMADMLRARLQESYSMYLEIMNRFQETMDELREELAVESATVQGKMDNTDPQPEPRNSQVLLMERIKHSFSKSNRDYQTYRLKFSNGEGTRRRLLDDLKEQNERLEKLLLNSDKEAQIISQHSSQTTSLAYESSLCEFWRKATALFRVLCGSMSCSCMSNHRASILLQHPRQEQVTKSDVHVLLMTQKQQNWGCYKARIELNRQPVIKPKISIPPSNERQGASQREKTPVHQRPEGNKSLRPALKIRHPSEPCKSAKKASFIQTTTSISFDKIATLPSKPITDLCKYLQEHEHDTGYLADDDCRYPVYRGASLTVPSSYVVTLHQVIHGQGKSLNMPFSRRQRYALALTLASSFVQLIESPWFASHWSEDNVVFLSDADQTCRPQIEQPHVCQRLEQPKPELSSSPFMDGLGPEGQDSLSRLAIALLELCFGSTLDSQPYRRMLPEGQTQMEKTAFDIAAALEWLKDVNEEAGQDYARAISWCLVDSRTLPGGGASSWRREMVQCVIRPLDACHRYLTGNY